MNIRNEKSKIYTFGSIILGIISVVSGVMILKSYLYSELLISISQLSLALFMLLVGTREVVARRNKLGYINYGIAILIGTVFIMRVFNI